MDSGNFKRQSSLSSSLRRFHQRHATTSTGELELVQHDYAQHDADVEITIGCQAKTEKCKREKSDPSPTSKSVKGKDKLLAVDRNLGSLHCTAILLGVLVSFGSLFSVREIFVNSGGLVPALLVWLSAGTMMFVGAQCYAELATTIPKSGGDFVYLYHALPTPMPAFMQVWMGVVLGSGASISVLARMGGVHLLRLVCIQCDDIDRASPAVILLAALIICVFTMTHCRSSSLVAWCQVILTSIKLLSFTFIISLGLFHIATGRTSNVDDNLWYPLESTENTSPMVAFAVTSLSLTGWQSLSFVTEEVRKPQRTIPYVTSFSVLLTICLSMALNLAYATLLTPQELASSQPIIVGTNRLALSFLRNPEQIACDTGAVIRALRLKFIDSNELSLGTDENRFTQLIGHKVLGSWSRFVHLPILVCALSDINVLILVVSRLFYSASREGQAPKLWSMLSLRYSTPIPAVLVMMPIGLVLLLVDITPFLSTFGPFQWLTSAMVVATLPIYRIRYPHLTRPFRVPLAFPFLYVTYCIFLTSLAIYKNPRVLGLVLALIAPGFPLQIILIRFKRPRRFLRLFGRVTRILQKLLLVAEPDHTENDTKLQNLFDTTTNP